jgi:quercetin dioxygenase-like cupin family protein
LVQRVRSSFLVPGPHGKLHHRGTPFSGLAYDVNDDGVVGPIRVVDQGVVTGISSDWIDLPRDGSRVDMQFMDPLDDYEPLRYNDERFTGVAYFFASSGECAGEWEYVAGRRTHVADHEWYKSGRELTKGDERGRPRLIIHDDGRLAGINFGDPARLNPAVVSRMALADDLRLIGRGIDMKILYSDDEGRSTILFRMAPGAVVPLHEHTALEQTYMLEGSLEDAERKCGAGDFVWRPGGNIHVAHAPDGATFLAIFNRPNRFFDGTRFFTEAPPLQPPSSVASDVVWC